MAFTREDVIQLFIDPPQTGRRAWPKPTLDEEDGCTRGDGFYCGCEGCEHLDEEARSDDRYWKSMRR